MGEPQAKTIETRHGVVSYREAGSGGPLLLLHGLGGGSRSWRRQYADLSDRYRVIGWDAPGYGASSLVETTNEAYGQAAIDFLDALEIDKAFVLGHSMGGVMAARLADMAPERVRRLVLSCTFLGNARPASEPLGEGYKARIQDRHDLDDAAFGAARVKSMVGEQTPEDIRRVVADIAGGVKVEGLEAACRMLHHSNNSDLYGRLGMPVLVVSGGADKVMPPERFQPLVDAMTGCEHRHFEIAGHAPYLEVADDFNQMLRGFYGV